MLILNINLIKLNLYKFPIIVFGLCIIPIIYVDVYLWAKIGDFRLLKIYAVLIILLSIINWKLIFKIESILPFYFVAIQFYVLKNDLAQLGALKIIEIISPIFFYFSGFMFINKSLYFNKILKLFLLLMIQCIFLNSFSLDRLIFGLSNRSDVDNFNYLMVAYNLLGIYVVNCLADENFLRKTNLIFSILTCFAIYCTGSRAVLLIFMTILFFQVFINLRSNKKILLNSFYYIAACLLTIIISMFFSENILFNRMNILNLSSDESLKMRVVLFSKTFKDLSTASDNDNLNDVLTNRDKLKLPTSNNENQNEPISSNTKNFNYSNIRSIDSIKNKENIDYFFKLIKFLFGRTLFEKYDINNKHYNHTILQIIVDYGFIYFLFFIAIVVNLYVKYIKKLNSKELIPISIMLTSSFFALADIYVLWWFILGYFISVDLKQNTKN